jgi:hypothetical protein
MKLGLVSIAACIATGSAAGQFSDPFITFNVSNANGSGTYTVDLAQAFPFPGGTSFASAALGPVFPLDITDGGGNVIATINTLNATSISDDPATPSFADGFSVVDFSMTAGSLDTTVEIISTFASFAPGTYGSNPSVLANAGFTASDEDGDGVTLSSNGPNGLITDFYVNGDINSGDLFASLADGFSGGAFLSPSTFDSTGFVAAGQAIDSYQFTSNFIISAVDEASGSFSIAIPSPASTALLALGGLAMANRRR